MAQQISVEIIIDGKSISPFSSLSLRQQFNQHHYFELRFNHDVLEAENAVTIDKAQKFLGKIITITLNTIDKSIKDNIFKGIVTDVSISRDLDSSGDLIFKGYSPTILLETGETNLSLLDTTLKKVFAEVTKQVPGNDLATKASTTHTDTIPYVTQYRESNFAFLRRLAAEYGEWFYYDGTTLNFGQQSQASCDVYYPADIEDFQLSVKINPLKFEQIAYLSKDHKELLKDGSSLTPPGLDTFGKAATDTSHKTFASVASSLTTRVFTEQKHLDNSVQIAKNERASDLVVFTAVSTSPAIKVGSIANVTAKKVDAKSPVDIGKYTVISVTHVMDGHGNYQNSFEAIPSSIKTVPNSYNVKPLAEPQLGIVTDIKDPDNLGKVKVRLLWQKDKDTTPYIRVMMPHSGLQGDDTKNRGFFFTPEVDDTVIVGFTQNDPDRPFVMGSVPHGKAIDITSLSKPSLEGKTNNENQVKAIRTRSGNSVYFFDNEKSKEQEIRIAVDNKNFVSVLTKSGKGTISIISNQDLEVQTDKSVTVKSKDITIEATNSITLKANKLIEIKAADVKIEGSKSFAAKGGATAKLEGAQTEVKGTATAKLAGAKVDVQGSAMTAIAGALVKIN